MKKIIGILSIALVALGFISCKGGKNSSEPEMKGKDFTIKVSSITATTANLEVLPKDESALYYIGVEPSADLDASRLNIDTLSQDADWYIQITIALYGVYGEDMSYEDCLFKGKITGEDGLVDELMPETEYIVYAFKMDTTGKASGEMAYVAFKTLPVVPDSTTTLKVSDAVLYDATMDGYWELIAAPADSSVVLYLSPDESETLDGEYNTADLNYYSYMYIEKGKQELSILKADVKIAVTGSKAAISGYVIASNMVQYNLDIQAVVEIEDLEGEDDFWGLFAPARKQAADKRASGIKMRPRVGRR
jgi:hypothetical protein